MSRPTAAPRVSWIDRLRAAEVVYLVDSLGAVREMSAETYCRLPTSKLRDSSVFLTRHEAERCAVTRGKARQ